MRSHAVLYDDDNDDDDGDGGICQWESGVGRSGVLTRSCNVDHPYCCCCDDDGGRDVDGGGDDDDLWTRNGVCAVRSYRCGPVMWSAHVSEICLCGASGDDFSS